MTVSDVGPAMLVAALLAAPPPARATGVALNFGQGEIRVHPGGTFTVPLTVYQAGDAFNGFEANLYFDSTRLGFVSTSPVSTQIGPLVSMTCGTSFHRFVAHPDYLEIALSLLCANTFTSGPGVIYKVKFQSIGPDTGETTLYCGAGTQFYRAGMFVNPLEKTSLTVRVTNMPLATSDPGPNRMRFFMEPPAPNPRLGSTPGRFAFYLPVAGSVSLDLFDSRGRRVAGREPEMFAPGRNSIMLAVPELAAGSYLVRLVTGWGAVARSSWVVVK